MDSNIIIWALPGKRHTLAAGTRAVPEQLLESWLAFNGPDINPHDHIKVCDTPPKLRVNHRRKPVHNIRADSPAEFLFVIRNTFRDARSRYNTISTAGSAGVAVNRRIIHEGRPHA